MPKLWDLMPPRWKVFVPPPTGVWDSGRGHYGEPDAAGIPGGGGGGPTTWSLGDNSPQSEFAKAVLGIVGEIYIDDPVTPNNLMIGPAIIDSSGIRLFNNGIPTIYLDNDGDAFFGANLDDPAFTSFIIFSNDQGYNGEDFEEGDVLIGDNSTSRANMFWDRSAGTLQFRSATTMQVQIATDGSLEAGAGAVTLDSAGITFEAGGVGSFESTTTIEWVRNATEEALSIQGRSNGTSAVGNINANRNRDAADGLLILTASGDVSGEDVAVRLDGSDTPNYQFNLGATRPLAISTTEVVIGETGDDFDLRVEATGDINNLFSNWGTANVGMGTASPAASAKLEISSTVGSLLLPRMTTTQRDALTAVNGMLIYNSSNNVLEAYENGSWVNI